MIEDHDEATTRKHHCIVYDYIMAEVDTDNSLYANLAYHQLANSYMYLTLRMRKH